MGYRNRQKRNNQAGNQPLSTHIIQDELEDSVLKIQSRLKTLDSIQSLNSTLNDPTIAMQIKKERKDLQVLIDQLTKQYGISLFEIMGRIGGELLKNQLLEAREKEAARQGTDKEEQLFDLVDENQVNAQKDAEASHLAVAADIVREQVYREPWNVSNQSFTNKQRKQIVDAYQQGIYLSGKGSNYTARQENDILKQNAHLEYRNNFEHEMKQYAREKELYGQRKENLHRQAEQIEQYKQKGKQLERNHATRGLGEKIVKKANQQYEQLEENEYKNDVQPKHHHEAKQQLKLKFIGHLMDIKENSRLGKLQYKQEAFDEIKKFGKKKMKAAGSKQQQNIRDPDDPEENLGIYGRSQESEFPHQQNKMAEDVKAQEQQEQRQRMLDIQYQIDSQGGSVSKYDQKKGIFNFRPFNEEMLGQSRSIPVSPRMKHFIYNSRNESENVSEKSRKMRQLSEEKREKIKQEESKEESKERRKKSDTLSVGNEEPMNIKTVNISLVNKELSDIPEEKREDTPKNFNEDQKIFYRKIFDIQTGTILKLEKKKELVDEMIQLGLFNGKPQNDEEYKKYALGVIKATLTNAGMHT